MDLLTLGAVHQRDMIKNQQTIEKMLSPVLGEA